jgi:hypothetical protein
MVSLRSLGQSLSAFVFGVAAKLDDLDEPARRRVRAAQIDAIVQLVPLTMTVNLLNAAIVVYVFWDTGSVDAFLAGWSALIVAIAALGFWSWTRTRGNRPKGASSRAITRMVLHATFLGGV